MREEIRALQLRLIPGDEPPHRKSRRERHGSPHHNLIGRRFFDGLSSVVVRDICPSNPAQVIVEREMDGKSWSISAGLIRLITKRERKARAA